jgi:hypothetical protein
MHEVQPESLLDKMGVAYTPDDKYKDASGNYLGEPAVPSNLKVCI